MSKIELKHIDKFYGKNHVLKDLNLTIEDGDFAARSERVTNRSS